MLAEATERGGAGREWRRDGGRERRSATRAIAESQRKARKEDEERRNEQNGGDQGKGEEKASAGSERKREKDTRAPLM